MSKIALRKRLGNFIAGKKTPNHTFTASDREMSAKIRQVKKEREEVIEEIAFTKQLQELAEVQQDYDELVAEEEEGEAPSDGSFNWEKEMFELFKPLVKQKIDKKVKAENEGIKEYTDEEIQTYIDQTPAGDLKKLRGFEDDKIKALIKSKLDNVGDDTLTRAVALVKA